ncbi:MAG: MerR family DNA-binding transcriptional regulator [Bryobacteraceae bacterium]
MASQHPHTKEPQAVPARATLTSKEVSDMFNIPRSTLHRWIKLGKIPEPATNPSNKQLVWTQTEINAISRFLVKGQSDD